MTETGWQRREFLRRAGIGALAAGAAPALLVGCSKTNPTKEKQGGGTLDKIKQQGYVTVGIANEQPYGYVDTSGNITGEAPSLAKEIFKELGVPKMKSKTVDFGGLIGGLKAGRFDTVAAGMTILPERCAQVAFADPDFIGKTAFLVPKGNPKHITRFDDVAKAGITLGVLTGAVEGGYAKSAGVKSGKIKKLSDQDAAYDALTAHRIDAVALTDISLNNVLAKHKGAPYEVTKGFIPVVDGKKQIGGGGFAFRKSDTDLLNAFNAKLHQLEKSGKELAIIKPFGFTSNNLPGDVTAAQLCKG